MSNDEDQSKSHYAGTMEKSPRLSTYRLMLHLNPLLEPGMDLDPPR
jgi:hypothetical protein